MMNQYNYGLVFVFQCEEANKDDRESGDWNTFRGGESFWVFHKFNSEL